MNPRRAVVACVAVLLLAGCAHEPASSRSDCTWDYNARCVQALRNGNLTTAEQYCNLGLEFTPHSAELWANKGLVALALGDSVKGKAQLRQAEAAFLQCLRLEPANAECQGHLEQVRRALSP